MQILEIIPGVLLRHMQVDRFKQGVLSIQFLRPMSGEEAALNALLPAVLLRGCQNYPDIRRITQKLDELYGASVGTLVRRIGDYQTTGFYCNFMEDRFAFSGDAILAPMLEFVGQLLLEPLMEDGGFCAEFTESEKNNLVAAIEYERSDKWAYASNRLLQIMCRADSFGLPRLGTPEQIREIDHQNLYIHYQRLLWESPVELFYVGAADAQVVRDAVMPIFAGLPARTAQMPPQTAFQHSTGGEVTEQENVTQGKLSMGFYTPITNRDSRFAAMQVCNTVFGSGMTSKLFQQVREKLSLCYAISSGYYSSKGILTVNAGIDSACQKQTMDAVMEQLVHCQKGNITAQELEAAKSSLLSGLQAVYDSPGAMEGFFGVAALSGLNCTLEQYAQQIREVTAQDVAAVAQTVVYHSSFFLKGETHA